MNVRKMADALTLRLISFLSRIYSTYTAQVLSAVVSLWHFSLVERHQRQRTESKEEAMQFKNHLGTKS